MKILSCLAIVFVLLLASCEDTKKTSDAKDEVTKSETSSKTTSKDTSTEKKESVFKEEKVKDTSGTNYPKITEENMVEFLTKYGENNPETKVKITTRIGDIIIDLYEDTPLHRANFIYLVKQEYYNNTFFHRIVPNFIIQGGNSDLPSTNEKRADLAEDYLLPAEIKRNHFYGSVSGAKEYRENPDNRSAPFEFFIFLGPPSSTGHLDGSYTVFGRVSEGMDVVEEIANLPADEGEWPKQNVYIKAEVL
ncbi:peptidylprolyl isomerase [Flavobacteriaceae bacterium TK19130]|nr:peptidylprolyl isomerase [Thermobacterium salinum]